MLINMTASYKPIESYVYDKFIAPAIIEISSDLKNELITQIENNAKVLDVGCGGGQMATELASIRKDIIITGLDLSYQQIERAKNRGEKLVNTQFIQGSALKLPFDDDFFDIVYSVGSIKHWPEPIIGLKECLRVLKPNGKLFVFELNKNCSDASAHNFTALWKIPKFIHPLIKYLFINFIASRSMTIEETKKMISIFNIKAAEVLPIKNDFAWMIKILK